MFLFIILYFDDFLNQIKFLIFFWDGNWKDLVFKFIH